MQITSRLDNTKIDLTVHPNSHNAIFMSGGLDSAILFHLLLLTNTNASFQPFSIDKVDGTMLYVEPVLDILRKKHNLDIAKTIIVGDASLPHNEQSTSAAKDVIINYKNIDYIYSGTNQNPPDEYKMRGLYPNRINKPYSSKFIIPFLHLNKAHIVDLMYEYDFAEIMYHTHTCTEQKVGRCNKCFQCDERAWAFNMLNKEDKGTK